MEIKGDNIYVDYKELPVVDQIIPGNFLVIETETGSNLLDFKNFIVGPENVNFYGDVIQNSSNISALSTNVIFLSSSTQPISANMYSYIKVVSTQTTSLLRTVSSNWYTNLCVASSQLTTNLTTFTAAALLPFTWLTFINSTTPTIQYNCSTTGTTSKTYGIVISASFTTKPTISTYLTNVTYRHKVPIYISSIVKTLSTLVITMSTINLAGTQPSFDINNFACDIICSA